MNIKKIRLDIFDWNVVFVFLEDSDKNINKIGKKYDLLQEDIEDINDTISKDLYDGGLTLTNFSKRLIVVIIYRLTSDKEKLNIVSHEIRHIVDRIIEDCNIKDRETPAYLTGYITAEILTN